MDVWRKATGVARHHLWHLLVALFGLLLCYGFLSYHYMHYKHYHHEAVRIQHDNRIVLTTDACSEPELRHRFFDTQCNNAERELTIGTHERAFNHWWEKHFFLNTWWQTALDITQTILEQTFVQVVLALLLGLAMLLYTVKSIRENMHRRELNTRQQIYMSMGQQQLPYPVGDNGAAARHMPPRLMYRPSLGDANGGRIDNDANGNEARMPRVIIEEFSEDDNVQ
jgi:hypothetical protein